MFDSQKNEVINRIVLDDIYKKIRREEKRILEENTERIIRANKKWINKRNEIISYFLKTVTVNYIYEISKYFESYNVDYTKYINLCISFV